MTRRTITFAEGLEEGIREKQIEMMRQQKRDVPFTEATNWVILQGLYWGAEHSGVPSDELAERVGQWIRGLDKINEDALDGFPPSQEYTPATTGKSSAEHPKKERLQKGLRTPNRVYRRPILVALYELGGRAPTADALSLVERKVKPLLNELDLQMLPSGMDLRWRNAAQWVRVVLIREGLMKADSQRGVWELSDKGVKEAKKGA